ncbi:MAG: FecR family protein [Chitinophagaceae bacterium]|nr:FecR family protein [Chitinophagaceae bacterium]
MDQQRFWLLVSLKLSGEATREELLELDDLIQRNSETGLKHAVISGIWNEKAPLPDISHLFKSQVERLRREGELGEESIPSSLELQDFTPVIKRKSRLLYLLTAAASVIVIFFCWKFFLKNKTDMQHEIPLASNIITTQKGSKTTVQLPDGTKVWLNADSRIYYDENFKGDLREIQLEGEAFFEVKKDSSRPFVIHTSIVDIKVLGTTFNVKSYNNEDATETSLICGKVEVSLKSNPEKKIILRPNEKLVVKHGIGNEVIKRTIGDESALLLVKPLRKDPAYKNSLETLWIDNKLVFDSETLEEVCKKLERWYNVKIAIHDEEMKKDTYTAIFDGETLLNVLTALKMADKLDFTIHNNEVSIFAKK